jgi:hypothetical protein
MALSLLVSGSPRGALAMVVIMFGLVGAVVVVIGAPWLILWPQPTRPPLGQYLGGFARGHPLTPPGVDPNQERADPR